MKNKILTVIIVSALVFGCNKHDTAAPYNNLTGGSWKNIGYGGGFAGFRFTPVPDTIKNYLQFDAARILLNNNGSQTCSRYTFVQDTGAIFRGLLTISDTSAYPQQYDVSISNDTLALYPHNIVDGFTNYYAHSLKTFSWCDSIAVLH